MSTENASYRSLLAIDNVPRVLGAASMSRLASRMFMLVIILYALSRFESAELAGWIAFASVAPGLLVSPLSGALLDRIGADRAVVVDMIISALLVATLVLVDVLGAASQAIILVLASLYSLTNTLSAAGIRTLLPRLVPGNALDRINAIDTAIYAVVDVLGPALAGVLFSFLGATITFLIISIAYGIAGVCVFPVRASLQNRPDPGSIWHESWEGMRVVVSDPTLRGLAISYSLYQMCWGALLIVVPVVVGLHFGARASDTVTGLLWSIIGLSGGLGALAMGRFRTMGRERIVMAIGMARPRLRRGPSQPVSDRWGSYWVSSSLGLPPARLMLDC